MNAHEGRKTLCVRCLTAVLTILTLGLCGASAQDKKSAAPAKTASPKSAPPPASKSTPSRAGGAGTSAAAHGTSTASHGPTTASRGPTAATGSHGITTSSGSHGPTTSNPHGATTTGGGAKAATVTGAGRATTTGGPSATVATGRHGATGGHSTAAATKTMGGRPVPASSHITRTANGEVRTRSNGKAADVHVANRGMDIHHGLNGNRRVEVERADHSRIVAERGGHGYVQRPYIYHGHEFGHRTYYEHGRYYDHYYGHYYYRGAYVDYYTPAYYYRPAFYGWAYNPWVTPVSYAWGWGGNPWYGYYGYYFTPYPVYPSASLWLTDYMISTTLAAAYQAQIDANIAAQQTAAADAAALTPAVKDMIAAEVQRQIALENAEAQTAQTAVPDPASSSVQRMLTDGVQHIFVAGRALDVVDAGGTECAISNGDALQLTGAPASDANAASLLVLSSKGGQECAKGVTVSVAVVDLQEMQNHMRQTIEEGMGKLQGGQGKGGLPTVPASANGAPVKASFAADAPGPDQNAATEINQQAQEADQAEKQVLSQASPASAEQSAAPAPAPAGPPVSISMGQTIDEVTGSVGQPTRIVDLGAKKIYIYKEMKVTFKNGKVTDVQ
jgi:hypothetical protein